MNDFESVFGRTNHVVEIRRRTLVEGATAASASSFTPSGNVAATNVQTAIQELDSEKVAKAGDTMTGTLTTQALRPDADGTRDIGSTTARYRAVIASQLRAVSGNDTAGLTLGSTANAVGRVDNATGTGSVTAAVTGDGATLFAALSKNVAGAHVVSASVTGKGGVFIGSVFDYGGSNNATANVSGSGAILLGFTYGSASTPALNESTSYGSVCAVHSYGGTGRSSGPGSFCGGYTKRGVTTGGLLEATNQASFVFGRATPSTSLAAGTASVQATGIGAVAFCVAEGGSAAATALASGKASFISGFAAPGETISATAANSQQFGPGTNSQAGSLSVGTTMRLKGTAGAPTVPRNGDLWVDSTGGDHIRMRSASVNQIFNRPTVSGSRASGEALTNLLTQLAVMNLIVDSTTA